MIPILIITEHIKCSMNTNTKGMPKVSRQQLTSSKPPFMQILHLFILCSEALECATECSRGEQQTKAQRMQMNASRLGRVTLDQSD
jgi:hypothetical protein